MLNLSVPNVRSLEPSRRLEAELSTGILSLEIARESLRFEDLCCLAARRNPKRGFLFISKVLGRHYPVQPSVMRQTYRLLGEQIPDDLPGPVLVIGMAETAICLGAGVWEEYVSRTGRSDVLFLQTTRYTLGHPIACEFQEEHSHASRHLIYEPLEATHRELFREARSLVLVDDEASTGKTFVNLSLALSRVLPALQRVVCAVLTDWRGPERSAAFEEQMPLPSSMISLLSGSYSFQARPCEPEPVPDVRGNGEAKDHLLGANYGRLGLSRIEKEFSRLPAEGLAEDASVLVLGTGEFVYPPFRMAEELESRGYRVFCQATTRSPIRPGDAIGHVITFPDNYDDGIENYLYNAKPGTYDRVYACYETPSGETQEHLARLLGAVPYEVRPVCVR